MIDRKRDPVYWTYDAGCHCPAHAEARFGAALYRDPPPLDREGNPPHPVYHLDREDYLTGVVCDDTYHTIVEADPDKAPL